jgi:hypothetical protein
MHRNILAGGFDWVLQLCLGRKWLGLLF